MYNESKEDVRGQLYKTLYFKLHNKFVPCHHVMARPQVADGGDGLQIWRVSASVLKKQSRTADRGWSSSLGVVLQLGGWAGG
jgi:hypothetical protein